MNSLDWVHSIFDWDARQKSSWSTKQKIKTERSFELWSLELNTSTRLKPQHTAHKSKDQNKTPRALHAIYNYATKNDSNGVCNKGDAMWEQIACVAAGIQSERERIWAAKSDIGRD